MSEQGGLFLRKGLIGTCAFAALVLLAIFYSTVSGAVDRAARQRLSAADGISHAVLTTAHRPAARGNALLTRVDN